MKLSVKNLGITAGVIWGGAVLLVGLAHLVWPNYGTAFLELAASIYPGYEIGGFGSVIIGSLYALLDGGIGGAIFAWLYNTLAAREPAAP